MTTTADNGRIDLDSFFADWCERMELHRHRAPTAEERERAAGLYFAPASEAH